jgi:hypothetical protein
VIHTYGTASRQKNREFDFAAAKIQFQSVYRHVYHLCTFDWAGRRLFYSFLLDVNLLDAQQ